MDTASLAVAGVTLVLFVAALFEKGLTLSCRWRPACSWCP
jgi:hypothetical protein